MNGTIWHSSKFMWWLSRVFMCIFLLCCKKNRCYVHQKARSTSIKRFDATSIKISSFSRSIKICPFLQNFQIIRCNYNRLFSVVYDRNDKFMHMRTIFNVLNKKWLPKHKMCYENWKMHEINAHKKLHMPPNQPIAAKISQNKQLCYQVVYIKCRVELYIQYICRLHKNWPLQPNATENSNVWKCL